MRKVQITAGILIVSSLSLFNISSSSRAESNKPEPPVPSINGITTTDVKPNSCVDCHKIYTTPRQFDGRLTTHMKEWIKKTPPELLEKAQRTMPEGVKLEGKHPDIISYLKVIPNDCLSCHSSSSKRVPQFRRLIHVIHLTGGKENHFIMNYQGQCTYCHKLDQNTGTWGFGSGSAQ
jgi:hypothetical protein